MEVLIIALLVYLLVVVGVLIFIWFNNSVRSRNVPISQGGSAVDKLTLFSVPSPWSTPQPLGNNTCDVYRINYGVAPTFSNIENSNNVSQTLPITSETCIDPDSLTAQQFRRTCVSENPYPCISFDSTRINVGQIEDFMAECAKLPPCVGLFGTLYVGTFDGHSASGQCISVQNALSATPTLGFTDMCVPVSSANDSNVFRIQRATATTTTSPDGNGGFTNTLSFSPNPAGLYARIIHRNSGTALSPVMPVDSAGKPLPLKVLPGAKVTLQDLNSLPNQGYLWALVDPLPGSIPTQQIVYSPSGTNFPPSVGLVVGIKEVCDNSNDKNVCNSTGFCQNTFAPCYYGSSSKFGLVCPAGYTQAGVFCNTFQTWFDDLQQKNTPLLTLTVDSSGLILEQFTLSDGNSGTFSTVIDYLPEVALSSQVSQINGGKFPFFISVV